MDRIDCVVIGAGVVGLAVARALAQQGREVMVLEGAGAIGTGASSRNSEVIHAGLYYPHGSLKAAFCVQGKQSLYRYCAERGIGHQRCGKLVVAMHAGQRDQLLALVGKAAANGVDDLVLLDRAQARAMEPELECALAVHSPSTGIIDSHAYMLALQADLESAGGLVVLDTPVSRARVHQLGMVVVAADGTELLAQSVVNAAGAQAQAFAGCIEGLGSRWVPPAYYAKGNYFSLAGRSPFTRLIYPLPEAAGLGVHLTIDLGGQARFGPDVQWVDSPDDLTVDPVRGKAFYGEIRKYWPGLPDGALLPDYAGIRAKIQSPNGPAHDFMVQGPVDHGVPGLVNLFGIESPGLTSALAIGAYVSRLV